MKNLRYLFVTAALVLVSSQAFALVNYTTIGGEKKCCKSVGPSGYAAQGCVDNPTGGVCAAKVVTAPTTATGRLAAPQKEVNYSANGM